MILQGLNQQDLGPNSSLGRRGRVSLEDFISELSPYSDSLTQISQKIQEGSWISEAQRLSVWSWNQNGERRDFGSFPVIMATYSLLEGL